MPRPTEQEIVGYFDSLSNWGRWGDDDELGTLNFITPQKRLRAIASVTEGATVSCSRVLSTELASDGKHPFQHYMISSGDASPAHGPGTASEWVGIRFHGQSITHLDALSHYHWNGHTYNGRPANVVGTAKGAEFLSVEVAGDGILTRGVLLDVPREHGVAFLDHDYEITPQDLERCEQAQQVVVESGDVVLISTGRDHRTYDQSIGWAGLRADCLPWLREREVSLLVGDTTHDSKPPIYDLVRSPIHNVAIAALGLWLIDNANLDPLADACAARQRWEFLFIVNALVMERSTGSPVNPIAVF